MLPEVVEMLLYGLSQLTRNVFAYTVRLESYPSDNLKPLL
jgi:hypothetical protein